MNILICPDSFKGSISSTEFCQLAKEVLLTKFPSANLVLRPLADGGENTLEIIFPHLWNAEIKWVDTVDPLLRPIKASYILYQSTAFVELASSSGLTLIDEQLRDIMHSTTYGTGLVIRHAIESGIKKVVLFVGGSATCDGGVGIAHALGLQYYNYDGDPIVPIPANIHHITDIEKTNQYADVEIIIATDVKNPLLGDNGTAYTYAAQKGASERQQDLLEEAMRYYAELIENLRGESMVNFEGIGAAGGTPLTLVGLFNAKIVSAGELILDLLHFESDFNEADYIITGEGCFDEQSFYGKLVGKIATDCYKQKKKLILIAGSRRLSMVGKNMRQFDIRLKYETIDDAIKNTYERLRGIFEGIELM